MSEKINKEAIVHLRSRDIAIISTICKTKKKKIVIAHDIKGVTCEKCKEIYKTGAN